MMIIDPPSPFETLQVWETFLAEMERIEPRTPQVEAAIADARARLRRKAR